MIWTPKTKELKINHTLAASSAFNLKLCSKAGVSVSPILLHLSANMRWSRKSVLQGKYLERAVSDGFGRGGTGTVARLWRRELGEVWDLPLPAGRACF